MQKKTLEKMRNDFGIAYFDPEQVDKATIIALNAISETESTINDIKNVAHLSLKETLEYLYENHYVNSAQKYFLRKLPLSMSLKIIYKMIYDKFEDKAFYNADHLLVQELEKLCQETKEAMDDVEDIGELSKAKTQHKKELKALKKQREKIVKGA